MKKFFKFWMMALGLCILSYAVATIITSAIKFIYFLPEPFFYITVLILSVTGITCLMSMLDDYLKAKYPNKKIK